MPTSGSSADATITAGWSMWNIRAAADSIGVVRSTGSGAGYISCSSGVPGSAVSSRSAVTIPSSRRSLITATTAAESGVTPAEPLPALARRLRRTRSRDVGDHQIPRGPPPRVGVRRHPRNPVAVIRGQYG